MYLTRKEAAELLRVTPRTLQEWEAQGKPPQAYKINGRILYIKDEIILAIKEGKL